MTNSQIKSIEQIKQDHNSAQEIIITDKNDKCNLVFVTVFMAINTYYYEIGKRGKITEN